MKAHTAPIILTLGHLTGQRLGPKAGLDVSEYRKISFPYWEWNPVRPALAKWLQLLHYPGFKNGLRLAELQRCYAQGSYSLPCHYMCEQSQLVTVKKGAEDGRNKW